MASVLAGSSIRQGQAAEPDYTLNPGDVLEISVWKEDGMDRETVVLPDYSINFPLAGKIMVRDKSTGAVEQEIKNKLAPYIPDASVTVVIKAPLGHVVSVIGQVAKPGEYASGHKITVMQALSMAGGLTPYASHSGIIILQRKDGAETSVPFPYDDVIEGQDLQSDIVLDPGDVVVVPTATLF